MCKNESSDLRTSLAQQSSSVELLFKNSFIEVAGSQGRGHHIRPASWSPVSSRRGEERSLCQPFILKVSVAEPRSPILMPEAAIAAQTTVMLQNLPTGFQRGDLFDLLERRGFAGCYNFIYVPINFNSGISMGYAIVCFSSVENAQAFVVNEPEYVWNEVQGFDELVERYRNRAIMHTSVPDAHRPVIFKSGLRIDFPAPTVPIRRPRVRPPKTAVVPVPSDMGSTDAGDSDSGRSQASRPSQASTAQSVQTQRRPRWADVECEEVEMGAKMPAEFGDSVLAKI